MEKEPHEDRLARWAKHGKPGSKALPAATVIPVRDGSDGLEVLMLRKNSRIAFGGMWVFPGGRVEPADHAEGDGDDELAPARRAAVREAEEEAGLVLEASSLLPFSHWTPPPITPKRYLTWFFLAPAPRDEIVIDGGEIHEHRWLGPRAALERRDAGEIELAPPTFVSLYELSAWRSVEQAVDAVRARTPERFATRIVVEEAGPSALWHGDAGFEDGDAAREGPRHRLLMRRGGWRYLRT